jgi:hypothetical protein
MPDQQAARLGEVLRNWASPPADAIDTLPKPTRKENQKGVCRECGGYHGLPAVHLDYVGHAWVTRALIESDPLWSWEPAAVTDAGEPLITNAGGHLRMWIRLTVHGKTLPAVGTCPSGKPEPEKELIGDALRNGAMRFGIALSLWAKDEWSDLESVDASGAAEPAEATSPAAAAAPAPVDASGAGNGPAPDAPSPSLEPARAAVQEMRSRMTAAQKSSVRTFMASHDIPSLATATLSQLELLTGACERVLNGDPS